MSSEDARYLNIEARQRPLLPSLASLYDFTVSEGESVNADIVLRSPAISLYCLDDATQRAIFVELPPEADLTTAPFVYQMQYDQALRLIALPYDTFRQLAQTLSQVQNLILIFSVPRSGTTLMSHILNQVNTVTSLSEPDAASQFRRMRPADGSRDAELIDLLDCTVRMLFKPNGSQRPATCAIKFRSEAADVMDLYHAAFPKARNIFLYRDAVGVVASFYRLYRTAQIPEVLPIDDYLASFGQFSPDNFRELLYSLFPGITEISAIQQLTLTWVAAVEPYLHQQQNGIPALAVRYADLNGKRAQTLKAIFEHCGLPVDQVEQALVAFEQDSQAGTMLARERPTEGNAFRLTDEQIAEIKAILRRHPVINTPDFIVPGTLRVE
ncbi:MAG: hypothetical protein GC204_17485 [Chloroflexi bacterium]|nr:hypothetical protein [Chloroflexota bacterium]